MSTVFHDVSLFLLYAVLAVFAQNAIFTVSLAVILEDPAHVVQHLHDRIAKRW